MSRPSRVRIIFCGGGFENVFSAVDSVTVSSVVICTVVDFGRIAPTMFIVDAIPKGRAVRNLTSPAHKTVAKSMPTTIKKMKYGQSSVSDIENERHVLFSHA